MPGRAEFDARRVARRISVKVHDLTPVSDFTDDQQAKVARARDAGIVNPRWAMQAALWADVPYYILCAYLEQESAKGENLWGNDSTWMRGHVLEAEGLEVVTEQTYKVYRAQRSELGRQGVGPMQLTSDGFQNLGDDLGGCWLPLPNMQAAAGWMRDRRDDDADWHTIARFYNGSEAYAVHNDELRPQWKEIIL